MSKVEKYLKIQEKHLRVDFEKISATYSDSDVKGGANEKIIGDFIKSNYTSKFVSIGSEVIDSFNNSSDEIDVCVCNEYQPFLAEPGQPLIAEGVDFVIQAKSTITTQEIPRIIKNCKRLKSVIRKGNKNDEIINVNIEDVSYFVDRIPYIVFANSTQLKLETIAEKLNQEYKNCRYEEQPDAFFILNQGCILNFREGKGKTWRSGEKSLLGFTVIFSGEQTLYELMRYIYTFIPKPKRFTHPLNNYFTHSINHSIKGKLKEE
jgi:hypothetical protein